MFGWKVEFWKVELKNRHTRLSSFFRELCSTGRGYTTHISKPTIMYGMAFMFYENLVKLLSFPKKHYFALVTKQSTSKNNKIQQNSLWSSLKSGHNPHPLIYKNNSSTLLTL